MAVKISITFLVLIQLAVAGHGQGPHLNFSSLTSKDGLLSNTVNAILKDRYGLMWFATDDGLNKYDGSNFTVYRHIPGDSNSLRANEILALYEDGGGNLWIGTSGGAVSMYDRKKDRFLHFPRAGDSSGLVPNAVIRGICGDRRGRIWIAQFESPYILDPVSRKLTKVDLGYRAGDLRGISLECVFADSKDRVWVGTDSGLFLFQPATNSFRVFRHKAGDETSLVHDHIKVLAEDGLGRLWVGTTQGLCVMRSDRGDFAAYQRTDPGNGKPGEMAINSIVPDRDGKLWVGTMDGLHVLDVRSGSMSTYLPDGNAHGLTSEAIKSIYIDREGIYWLGTYRGGVDKFDKNLNLFDVKLGDAFPGGGTRSPVVSSFAERRDGKVWVGTEGGGLYSFDRVTGKIKQVPLPVNSKERNGLTVLSLLQARSGRLYIGTLEDGLIVMDTATGRIRHLTSGGVMGSRGAAMDSRGAAMDSRGAAMDSRGTALGSRGTALSGDDIYSMLEDRGGRIWVGTNGQGVTVLENDRVVARYMPAPVTDGDILLPVNGYIRALEEDRDGNVWIGTHGGGLAVLRPGDHHFTLYNQSNSRLPFDKVHALHCDSRGRMWVGTYGGGLSVLDGSAGHFINYTEKDGLQNTTIYQIAEDTEGHIWVSTNTGLSCFMAETKTFRNFSGLNGLQGSNFVHGAGVRLSDGELLFGGVEGFNYFNPAHLTINRNMPAIVLTDLQIANKSVQPGSGSPIADQISVADEIRLDYKQNFALSFVALNYTLPKRNQYAYLLEGVDKDWNVGAMNTARYTNLDPGRYRFRVKASNNDGLWSTEERTISIYVKPPFWRTVYAYILYVLGAGGLLFYSRHRGIARIRNKFQLERERAEVRRTQELDRLKLKFLTNLSHEFRTPIALIMGPVNELLSQQPDGGSKEKLSLIRRNAGRLLNLVNQLLDFRKMEEQELRLLVTPGELVSFVSEVVHSFSDLSGRKHIGLDFTSNIQRLDVLFDHDKIERILFNLLSNAFKFTLEEGSISVVMEAEKPDEAGKSRVSIRVIDTGIGIPAEIMQRIFERFFQHSSGEAVLNQGTGIGLSITKEFVRMHGGSIEVESEAGRGSVFTVRIPFEMTESVVEEGVAAGSDAAEPVMAGGSALGDAAPETEMPTVLLVEDNEDFRWYLKDNLKRNYRIVEAANGNEGWQKALAAHPQLIVSDISMPQMDGIVLSKKLKADKRTCHVPIILLTAVTGEAQQVQGLETGANDYITKPFSFEVLHAKMRSLLELGRNQKSIYTRQIKLVQPEPGVQTEDERLLQSVAHCLEENIFSTQLSVEFLSRQVGMSRSSLYRKILEITGETPVEYIRSFKLEKAAMLLEKSDLTVAEVAYQTGFTTPNYFARAFKAKFNILPSEYIAQKRKRRENPI